MRQINSSWVVFAVLLCELSFARHMKRELKSSPNPNETPAVAKLRRAIDNALPDSKLKENAGIIAISLDKGDVLYSRNADQKLIPASTNKIFTAYTALKKLKPNATFKTYLYSVGPVHNGELAGDLYIKGGGDPSFVSERMWMFVNESIRAGIRVVTGNIVGDSTYFDTEKNPESRPKYLKDQAYNAPIGGLSFNFNTCTIYVRPNEVVGQPPVVYTDPQNSYIEVVNQAKTGRAGGTNSIVVSRTDFVKGDIGDTVLLRGSIPADSNEIHFYKNIVNPSLYTAHMFKNFLEQRGIKVQGNVLEGEVPKGAKQLLEFDSQPLWQVIWGMNKFSNNFVADQILKKVGAEVWGVPGSIQKGLSAMEDVLEDIGIPKKSYTITDGSGLTRNTRVTVRQMSTVLAKAYQDFSMSSEFIASLGIAGEDGTLKHRFPSSKGTAIIRAKTGTLDGVSALAGYAQTAEGETIVFAIILNDPRNRLGRMSPLADAVGTAIAKFTRDGE